jgi:predicted N-acetyltransferase YhbS
LSVPVDVLVEGFDAGRDSLESMTALLHRSYAPLLARGLNYTAATQPLDTTRKRLGSASLALVARRQDVIVGTIAYYERQTFVGGPSWFGRDGVALFAQFAVEPVLQRLGIGRALLDAIETRARSDGRAELACDTALDAAELVAYYERLGYRKVEEHQYQRASYRSAVLSKALV